MELQGKRGDGAFQWNRGGWFGSQVGSTLWLLILGALLLAQQLEVGAMLVLLGALPNAIGWALWRRRRAIAPYPAIQILIASCGLCTLAALAGLRAFAPAERATEMPSLWLVLLFPALMLSFHVQESRARKGSAERSP